MTVFTPQDVAKLLKLSDKNGYITVLRHARGGRLKGSKIGKLWRFTEENVQNFLEDTRR